MQTKKLKKSRKKVNEVILTKMKTKGKDMKSKLDFTNPGRLAQVERALSEAWHKGDLKKVKKFITEMKKDLSTIEKVIKEDAYEAL